VKKRPSKEQHVVAIMTHPISLPESSQMHRCEFCKFLLRSAFD